MSVAASKTCIWMSSGGPKTFSQPGATLLRAHDAEIEWDVLADPEDNEFSVFAD